VHSDTLAFLEALFAHCERGFLTFTAIHPDGQHPTPSRHVPVGDRACLTQTLACLINANQQGWGAYVAISTRKTNLGRWRRGGKTDLHTLPALFVDIDRPPETVLPTLLDFDLAPSCIVASGHGVHVYWLLHRPTHHLEQAQLVLHGLAAVLHGDLMSSAQSMRLPGTQNLKTHRDPAWCEIIELQPERRYQLKDFVQYKQVPCKTRSTPRPRPGKATGELNPRVVDALIDYFMAQGFKLRDTWLNGPCVYPEHHKHDDSRPSFAFNTATSYGYCHRCGTLLAKDLCHAIGIDPTDFGGLMKSRTEV
jgi:hypothetical protein